MGGATPNFPMNKNLDTLLDTLERLVRTRELITMPQPIKDSSGYTQMPQAPMHAMNIDGVISSVTVAIQNAVNGLNT